MSEELDKALKLLEKAETPIGHAFASFVNLTRENEKLKSENESIKDELRERVLELSSLSEKYDLLKDEADWRFGHSVERGERE